MSVLLRVAGVDEAGRGCLAGPVVAAAVVLAGPIAGLRDSKRLGAAALATTIIAAMAEQRPAYANRLISNPDEP